MATKYTLLLFSIFTIISCKNETKEKNIENDSLSIKNSPIQEVIENDTESIVYDTISYPIDSILTTKVLTIGTFHRDEVSENAEQKKWFGLFQNNTSFYLAETNLKTERVHDEILDMNENEKTGWKIKTENTDKSIILIEASNYITNHQIQECVLSKKEILPDDTLKFNYLGINYEIFAIGGKKKIQDEPEELFEIWNYKLYLTATINGQKHKSLLVAKPTFDDQMIYIIFAGDIDGDGILDLIIDTSRHYNVKTPTIYLSKPANKGEIVKPIGCHITMGC